MNRVRLRWLSAVLLTLAFGAAIHPEAWQVGVFVVALALSSRYVKSATSSLEENVAVQKLAAPAAASGILGMGGSRIINAASTLGGVASAVILNTVRPSGVAAEPTPSGGSRKIAATTASGRALSSRRMSATQR